MKRTLFTLLLAMCTLGAFAQNGYKVERGERPVIDLEKVPTDAYEKGVIKIKITEGMCRNIPAQVYTATSKGYVETGVAELDQLNAKYSATEYKPLLHNLYNANSKSNEFKARHDAWGFNRWFYVTIDSKADVKDVIKQYTSAKDVEFAEPVYKKRQIRNVAPKGDGEKANEASNETVTKWTPSDTRYSEQWHYNNTGQNSGTTDKDIDLPEAWEIEKGYNQVIVAVIDGGIQTSHPDLSANIWSGVGYNFVNSSSTISAEEHGTHVAGTVAAVTNNSVGVAGVAGGSGSGNGVKLMSCQVFTSDNSGGFDDAPIYAADNGASISQNSWGYTNVNVYDQTTLDAIDYFNTNGGGNALDGGITIFAAGNDAATGNWYPGCYSGTLSVAATNHSDVISYYSNYGAWVDISAPGGEQEYENDPKGILSTLAGSTYAFYQGTSMACPHVSGVAALLISNAYRNGLVLTNTQLSNLLTENVDNHYGQNTSTYSGKLGSGRLNAQLALNALQSMLGTQPTEPPTTPTGLTTSDISTSGATLNWTAVSGATSYTVKVGTSTYTTGSNSYTLSGLTDNTTYTWSVMATNSYGSSSYSSTVSFTTDEIVPVVGVDMPYSQSFGSSSLPTGWTTQNEGTSITERWSMSNTNKAGGSAYELKCKYQNVNPATTRIITPAINTEGVQEVEFSFKHFLDAYASGVTLKVQTSNDLASWTDADWSVATTSTNISATTVTVSITSGLNSTSTYFALVATGNLYQIDNWYIDDVSVQAASAAPEVVVPTVTTSAISAVATTTATAGGNVTADGNATVTTRGVCYSTSQNPTTSSSKVAAGSGTGAFTASLSGLTANTTYYVRAYATNSAGTAYGAQVSFTTDEEAVTPPSTDNDLPFSEIFSSSSLPTGWTTANSSTSITQRWSVSNTKKAGGAAYEMKCTYQNITGTTRLITPAINTQGVDAATLTFKHFLDAYKAGPVLKVQTSTDLSTWTDVWSVTTTSSNISATTVTAEITANLNSETTYIAFVVEGNLYNIDYWYIDNVSLVASTSTTPDPNPDPVLEYCASKGSNYSYEWIDLVQFEGINRTSTADGGYIDMTSMQATVCPGQDYTIYFSCGFKSTSYTEYWAVWIDFDHSGTFDDDEKVTTGSSSSSGTLSGTVSIPSDALLGTTRMRVSMKYNAVQTSACETFSYGEVEDYSINVTNTSGASVSTSSMFAEQLGNEVNDLFTLYPNPTSNALNISFDGLEGTIPVCIYDVQGRLILRQEANGQLTTINVENLVKGVYFITVEDEKEPVTKKFVKM